MDGKNRWSLKGGHNGCTTTPIRKGVDVLPKVSLDDERLGGKGESESICVVVAEVSSLASHKAEAQQLSSIRG